MNYDGSGVVSLLTMSPPQSRTDMRSRRIVLNQAGDTLYWVDKSSNAILQSPLINPSAQTLSIQPAPVSPELIAVVSIDGTD